MSRRTKKMGTLLPTLLLHQSILAVCEVATMDGQTVSLSNEMDDPTWLALYEPQDPPGPVSVSEDCNDYGIDDLPHPRIILLGPTGVGKSTLANQLLGRNPFNKKEQVFSVGHGVDSYTLEITYVVGNWLGYGPCFTIIDTPGTSDSEGRDYEHALAVANIMKNQIKSVDIFLLCFSGQNSRFKQSTIDFIKLFESIFSKEMWKHAVTEVTFWKHDRRSVRERQRRDGMDELKRHKEWNSQYKEELNVTIEIPSVYIDPVLPIFDAEDKDFLEEGENEAFKKYTDELFEFGNKSDPFVCDGNCKAPNGYFLGNPWIKTRNITKRKDDNLVINCQIWNGMQGKASKNVIWTHNGDIIYKKTTPKYARDSSINSTDMWGSTVKFGESVSPGGGHYTDFTIEFKSFEENMQGNYTCENGMLAEDNVAQVFMRVDGTWGQWGPWGKCSISCLSEYSQMGSKKRVRNSVPPKNGGKPTNPLDGEEIQICAGEKGPQNPVQCPKDFSWNPWTEWSECSQVCGDGISYRIRSCNQGSHGGKRCPVSVQSNLSEKEEKPCKMKDCPNCILLGWQEWSPCSKTCMSREPGTMKRQRSTKEEDPASPVCKSDEHSQEKVCNTTPCPVNGGWTPWSSYGPCSATCGSPLPTQIRRRSCTEPTALYGGKPCSGLREKTRTCNKIQCPVDGEWTPWGSWSGCSASCGFASPIQIRTRSCTEPLHGGKLCPGPSRESRNCNHRPCPVDGGWTPWSNYGGCSRRCGGGQQFRTRSCTQPPAQYGGKPCTGANHSSTLCNTNRCERPKKKKWYKKVFG